ncbi:MAG TPA: hypothetical protein VIY30_07640 [Burkholderiaceae bacterium]
MATAEPNDQAAPTATPGSLHGGCGSHVTLIPLADRQWFARDEMSMGCGQTAWCVDALRGVCAADSRTLELALDWSTGSLYSIMPIGFSLIPRVAARASMPVGGVWPAQATTIQHIRRPQWRPS